MKKNFIFCFVALCAVLFAGCKKDNPAEQYVGVYDLIAIPHLSVSVPVMGNVEMPSSPLNVLCTIALDGDEGKVVATTDLAEDIMHGIATEAGLQFDPANTVMSFHLDELGDIDYNGVLTFPLITFSDGVNASWESTVTGTVSATVMGVPMALPANGTVSFTAIKRAQ